MGLGLFWSVLPIKVVLDSSMLPWKPLTDESKVNFQHNIYSYNLNDFHGSFINEDQHQCCNKNISTNLCSSLHNHVAINTKQCKWYRGGWTVFTTATCKVRSTDMEHLSFNMIKTVEAKIQSCFSLEELKSRMKIIGLGWSSKEKDIIIVNDFKLCPRKNAYLEALKKVTKY